jgi:hypothetical protein
MSEVDTSSIAPATNSPSRRRWRRRIVLAVVFVFILVFAGWGGYRGYLRLQAQRELDDAVAAIDQTETGWRLEDLEAARQPVADDQNAALAIIRIHQKLPDKWKPTDPGARPERLLTPQQTEELRKELTTVAAALAQTEGLADRADGRFPTAQGSDPMSASPNCENAQDVALLLRLQAKLLAQEEKGDPAAQAILGILAAARAVGDEPRLLAQLVRLRCHSDAVMALERTLAQTQPSAASLGKLQQAFEEEERTPLMLWAALGERAGHHQRALAAEAGDVELSKILQRMTAEDSFPREQLFAPSAGTVARRCHARMLAYLTKLVDLAKLPPEEQGAAVHEFVEERNPVVDGYELFQGLDYRFRNLPNHCRRQLALFRCAIVALAAERYRLAQKRWPEKQADLIPAQLKSEIVDPFGGHPLQLQAENDGLFIRSLGRDAPQGASAPPPRANFGFPIWDVSHRRQPPKPEDTGARRGPFGRP